MAKPVCVVVGVGPGNGAAFARKFAAAGLQTALLARNQVYLDELCSSVEGSRPYRCDVRDPNQIIDAFTRIKEDMGPVQALIYNAGAGQFSNVEETSVEAFENAWRVNALGCLVASQQVIPDMVQAGRGNIVVIGATASLKGSAGFAPFASAKASQRSLAQSMARHLGPKKIHVSYVILDGIVDLARTRQAMPDKPDEFFMQPDDIAQAVFYLTEQPGSAWTFELDLRPFAEKW